MITYHFSNVSLLSALVLTNPPFFSVPPVPIVVVEKFCRVAEELGSVLVVAAK